MDASQEALDFLRANPQHWRAFREKYGSLPSDFAPPRAPPEAEDYLSKNPDSSSQFEDKYGYTPQSGSKLGRVAKLGVDLVAGGPLAAAEVLESQSNGGQPGVVSNVRQLGKRSGARLLEGVTELPSAASYAAGALPFSADPAAGVPEASFGAGIADARPSEDDLGLSIKLGRKPTADEVAQAQTEWDATHGKNKPQAPQTLAERSGSAVRNFAAPVTESKPVLATRAWAKSKEDEAVQALTPAARRAIELSLVENDEQGNLQAGAGASDPWWWTANVIDVGVQAAPGFGVTGAASRLSYAAKYQQVLAELALKKVPQSVALRVAEREAMKAAKRGAVIAGGLSEGATAAGQDASQTRETIESLDEETLMAYPGYVELRDKGLSHEQARDRIAGDKAASVAIASGAVVGITGAPMNAYFGKLVAKLGRTAEPTTVAQRLATSGKGALGEGAQEFVQEGSEQLIQNKAEQPITGVDTWEGVLQNSLTGFVLGGTVGGALDLAVSGKKAKTKEAPVPGEPPAPMGPVQAAETKYEAASKALEQGLASARDPNVKIKYDAIQKLREDRKVAMVNLTRELLHAGAFKEEQQAKVSEALRQAEAEGVAATPGKPAGGDVSPQRDVALEAVANAEMLDENDANDLISNGFAKVNPRGVVVLTPEGRRQRKAAQDRAKAEESSQTTGTKTGTPKAATGVKSAADQGVKPARKPAQTPAKPVIKLATERRTVAAEKAAQRAARKARPAQELAAERAAVAAKDTDAFKAGVQRQVQESDQTSAEIAGAGIATQNPQMRDAFKAALDRARRARAGLPESRARGAFRLKGQPETATIPGKGTVKVEPVQAAKDAAIAYRKAKGITAPEPTEYAKVDVPRAKRIAKAFDEMKHEPNDPTVKRAYHAMINETKAQWDEIKKTGLKVEFIKPGQADPYAKSPRMAIEDVRNNNHLWVFPTDSGFGSDNKFAKDNPMLEDAGETVGGHPLKNNDVFRIVHDYFGHVQEANGFRADGEENAWRVHAAMYSPLARRAMTTETRGQNSWVNYGPKGEANRSASAGETTYADQKIGLLPAEFSSFPGPTTRFKHFSTATEDRIDLDPERMGTGFKGAEAKRGGPKVVSLYGEHGETEPEVANGRTRYNVDIPNEDLYNASTDPAGLLRAAQIPYGMTTDAQGNTVPVGTRFDMNKFEELTRDAGYLGYHTPEAQGILKGQARIFQKYPATREGADRAAAAARVKRTSEETVRGLLTPEENARLKKASAKKLIEVFDELPSGAELAASAVAGQAKRGWYRRSSEALVNVFGPDAPRFAALLAALSPQTSVEWNFRNATAMWVAWDKGGRPTDRKAIEFHLRNNLFPNSKRIGKANVLPAWINNTIRALSAEDPSTVVLSGPKVDSFAANLRGETERVTLDAWMANWAGVNQELFKGEMNVAGDSPGMRPGYLAFAARVREAAKILSDRTGETWTPSEVQETVWSWAKTLYEQAESFGALATARELVDNQELTDDLINATPDFAGLFADPEISASLSGTVYGDRAAASARQATERSGAGGKTPPAAQDARHLRKAADRLEALRQTRKAAEAETRSDSGLRVGAQTKGMPRADLEEVAARVKKELGVTAKIAESQSDLPSYLQEIIPNDGVPVTGAFYEDPITGEVEVWYVRENLDSKAEAYENALHETVGHMGLRAVLSKSYHKVMDDVRASFPAQVASAARRNAIEMNQTDPVARRRLQSLATEEMIAYAAGQVLAKRGALSQQSVWRRVIAKVRDILRSVGLLNNYSGHEIEALIYRARDFFRKPAQVRAQEIAYRSNIAAAVKQQTADAPQWLDPSEYLSEDTKAVRAALDAARVPPGKPKADAEIVFPDDFDDLMKTGDDNLGFNEVEAIADGQRVGYITLSRDMITPEGWEPTYVYVNPRYRGKGIAQRLHEAVTNRLGIPPSYPQSLTPHGRAMWRSFNRRGVDFSDTLTEGEAPELQPEPAAFAYKQGPTGNNDLDSFIKKIGQPPQTLRQRWNGFRQNLADRAALALFDEFHGIKRAEDIAGISSADSGYKSARLSKASSELTQMIVENGPPIWNDGAPDLGKGMGLLSVLAPLKGNVNLWLAYMTAQRANRLMGEGRENLFTQPEIDAALDLAKSHPEFNVARQQYNVLQGQVLDFAQEAGVIDPQGRALWEHADYIPFHRIVENGLVAASAKGGKGIGFVKNQIKRLTGGKQNIGDPMENIVRNWLALMDASLKAYAGRTIIDNLDGSGLVTKHRGFDLAQAIIPLSGVKQFIRNNPVLAQTLQSVGLDPAKLPPQAFAGLQKMLAIQAPKDEDVVSVWRTGKREYWTVHDPLLLIGLQGLNPKSWGPLMKLLTYPKRILTKGVTLTPQFAIKNYWRDVWHVFVQGARADKTRLDVLPSDSFKGLVSTINKDAAAMSLLAAGGSFTEGYLNPGDMEGSAKAIRRSLNRGKTHGILLNTPTKMWRFYRDMQSAAENANRVAMYNAALRKGLTRREAAFAARDLLDFSMKGNNAVVQFLVSSVPFFNARVQGLYRLGTALKEDFVAVGLRGMLITLATAALLARNHDDERYKALTDQEKSNYWHFFNVLKDGDHFKLPKPFEVGTIFGTIPEAIGDAMFTNADEPDAVKQSAQYVGYAFEQTLNLAPQPQAIWPLVELAINKDTFTGSPILTQGDEAVLPEDQRGPRTSPTYAALADAMPGVAPEALRSPKQLEHLGRGYLGNLQDYALVATDALVREMRGEPKPPAKAAQDIPGLRDFYTNGVPRNNRHIIEMYKLADEAAKIHASVTRAEKADTTEGDARVEELEQDNGPLLDVEEDFRKAAQSVTDLKKEQRQVQLDETMSPEDKRAAIDDIQQEINDIAKDVYDLRPGGKLNPEAAGNLLAAPPSARATILRNNNMPATAALLESLG